MKSDAVVALTSIRVVDSARVAPKPKNPIASPTSQPVVAPASFDWAKWLTLAIACVALCFSITSRTSDKAAIASDEHVRGLMQPSIDSIGSKIDTVNSRLADLNGKIEHVQGQVDELNTRANKIATEQDGLKARIDGQEAILHLQDPNRTLATIQGEIEMAEKEKETLPASRFAEYRNALSALPQYKHASSEAQVNYESHYWLTVAAIINYQSLINQLSGEAPDPSKVSHPCSGLTDGLGGHNLILGASISNCVLDLDATHNILANLVVKNSVVRYHGGRVSISGVTFVNCTFILDLPAKTAPAQPAVLLAILNSDNQKVVKMSTTGS